MALSSRITLIAALALAAFQAQAVNVTVAYQTSAEPAKVAQADNTFAKASGATVDWRKFDSGASIVRALASGDVQIGNLGSSPLAVAATQQVPIEVFLLASKLGNSEALVVKKSITKPQDLIGKRIAVPFISTTHYSLLSALKHWGIKPGQVQILNLQPPAIIAAWQRLQPVRYRPFCEVKEVMMLQISHLSADYGGKPALADINLTLDSGELLVVLGPSGCGKTTLLNLIAGFVPYQHGSITLEGQRVEGPGADRGVVFQHEGLLPWRNVQDNVALGLQLAGVDKTQRRATAARMLKKVGLEGAEKRFIWQLSGGQRQRVGIARALAANPQLLLLDEPFGALDAFTREQMQTLLLSLWHETGKKVLLITHDIEEAVFMATELVLLSPGPGRVLERLSLDFGRRFVAGESCRSIKSDPRFIEQREYVLSRVFEQREAFS